MSQKEAASTAREWRESAPYWEKHAGTIRAMFAPLTRALSEAAGIVPGQTVLDVAGGPGEPSLTIAETVGPSGLVTCTDAIEEMVDAARSEALRRGIMNVDFRQCGADALPFDDDSFDTVVSRLGAMFFPDPLAALREMLRVTKPRGTLSLAVWGKSEVNPYSYVVNRVVSRYIQLPPAVPGAPDAFRFAEPDTLASILRDAGASDVRERVLEFDIEAPISPEEFWTMRSEISGTLREKLAGLSQDERVRVGQEVQAAARDYFPNNLMSFPAQAIIVTGTKPWRLIV